MNPSFLSSASAKGLVNAGKRLKRDKRGNVLMMTAFAMVPMTIAVGAAIDYSRASRSQTKLNAAADAAALAAVTQPMMRQTDEQARQAAINMFNAQASGITGVTYNTPVVTITTVAGAVSSRNVSVTYTATSANNFSGVLNMPSVPIGGTATAKAAIAPNVDFYLMLDTSPSMALPATTSGIATMIAKTNGCAFACHQSDLTAPEVVTYNGKKMSYFTYSRSQGVVLRTDLVTAAVADLTDVAANTATQNGAIYRMALAQFNSSYSDIVASPTTPASVKASLASAESGAPDGTLVQLYCRNSQRACGVNDSDQASNFTAAFAGSLANMPLISGNGTTASGDTPQAMLFIITDGMRDEAAGGRVMGPIPTAQCDAIKNRKIKIAILYTEYLPAAASDTWSVNNVRTPYLSPTDKISPALVQCATPGLFYKVSTNDDISAALTVLFRQAISSPRITG